MSIGDEQTVGLCLTCNYPLHGLPSARCPECGREFDPADPATMNMGRALTPWMKWLLGPVGRLVTLASVCAAGFALWSARLPGGQVRNSASLWILVGLGVLWVVWPVMRLIVGRRCGWPQSLLLRGQKQRALTGGILLAAAGAVWLQAPLRVGFYLSRPAMDRMARQLIESKKPYGDARWLGVYPASHIKAIPGGVRFTTEESDVTYKAGFVYLPKVDPKKTSWRSYHYVRDGWWTWREET